MLLIGGARTQPLECRFRNIIGLGTKWVLQRGSEGRMEAMRHNSHLPELLTGPCSLENPEATTAHPCSACRWWQQADGMRLGAGGSPGWRCMLNARHSGWCLLREGGADSGEISALETSHREVSGSRGPMASRKSDRMRKRTVKMNNVCSMLQCVMGKCSVFLLIAHVPKSLPSQVLLWFYKSGI